MNSDNYLLPYNHHLGNEGSDSVEVKNEVFFLGDLFTCLMNNSGLITSSFLVLLISKALSVC